MQQLTHPSNFLVCQLDGRHMVSAVKGRRAAIEGRIRLQRCGHGVVESKAAHSMLMDWVPSERDILRNIEPRILTWFLPFRHAMPVLEQQQPAKVRIGHSIDQDREMRLNK